MMIATVCPTDLTFEETTFTLQFATRVRNINLGTPVRNSNIRNLELALKTLRAENKEIKKKKQQVEEQLVVAKKDANSKHPDKYLDTKLRQLEETKKAADTFIQQLTQKLQDANNRVAEEKILREQAITDADLLHRNLKKALSKVKDYKHDLERYQTALKRKEMELDTIVKAHIWDKAPIRFSSETGLEPALGEDEEILSGEDPEDLDQDLGLETSYLSKDNSKVSPNTRFISPKSRRVSDVSDISDSSFLLNTPLSSMKKELTDNNNKRISKGSSLDDALEELSVKSVDEISEDARSRGSASSSGSKYSNLLARRMSQNDDNNNIPSTNNNSSNNITKDRVKFQDPVEEPIRSLPTPPATATSFSNKSNLSPLPISISNTSTSQTSLNNESASSFNRHSSPNQRQPLRLVSHSTPSSNSTAQPVSQRASTKRVVVLMHSKATSQNNMDMTSSNSDFLTVDASANANLVQEEQSTPGKPHIASTTANNRHQVSNIHKYQSPNKQPSSTTTSTSSSKPASSINTPGANHSNLKKQQTNSLIPTSTTLNISASRFLRPNANTNTNTTSTGGTDELRTAKTPPKNTASGNANTASVSGVGSGSKLMTSPPLMTSTTGTATSYQTPKPSPLTQQHHPMLLSQPAPVNTSVTSPAGVNQDQALRKNHTTSPNKQSLSHIQSQSQSQTVSHHPAISQQRYTDLKVPSTTNPPPPLSGRAKAALEVHKVRQTTSYYIRYLTFYI
jgi:hypothetical protein